MYKHSKQRDLILEYLKSTKSHPTPEQIFDGLRQEHPQLGIATVYRNLKALCEQGLIRKLNVGETADRYDADLSNHYHFHCEACGEVSDIYEPELDINFKNDNGTKVKNFEIYGYGVCSKCVG
ncbi:MAG: transcriptional repressor [Clostridia bacterium]|nr:transcriptional repressor [Clostridia bacterium]MBR6645964.1 transcriptional repressor [Clostridia bacterium]